MKATGPASRKKTVRFDSSEPSEQGNMHPKPEQGSSHKDAAGGQRSYAPKPAGGEHHGNEELSRVFALLQGWLDLDRASGLKKADSDHWHRCAYFMLELLQGNLELCHDLQRKANHHD